MEEGQAGGRMVEVRDGFWLRERESTESTKRLERELKREHKESIETSTQYEDEEEKTLDVIPYQTFARQNGSCSKGLKNDTCSKP